MGQWKRNKNGRFAGSVGSGKDQIPKPNATGPLSSPNDSKEQTGPSSLAEFRALSEKVKDSKSTYSPDAARSEFQYVTAAEKGVLEAEERWENARSWAYPGVGDIEAEEELAAAYDNLCHARENLHRARLLAAQSPEGRDRLESEMNDWTSRATSATQPNDGTLKYLVRAQEIHDVLAEVQRQSEVEEEFQRIVNSSNVAPGGD